MIKLFTVFPLPDHAKQVFIFHIAEDRIAETTRLPFPGGRQGKKRLRNLFELFGEHLHGYSDDNHGSHFPAKPYFRFIQWFKAPTALFIWDDFLARASLLKYSIFVPKFGYPAL